MQSAQPNGQTPPSTPIEVIQQVCAVVPVSNYESRVAIIAACQAIERDLAELADFRAKKNEKPVESPPRDYARA